MIFVILCQIILTAMKKYDLILKIILISFLTSICFALAAQNIPSKKDRKKTPFEKVEKMPEYPGGIPAMNNFILENIKYPENAKKDKITGVVHVKFIIQDDGSVSDVMAVKKIGGGCDEEAVRVVKLMPKWSPGSNKGENVPVYMKLPVKFDLK